MAHQKRTLSLRKSILALVLWSFSSLGSAFDPIHIKGSKFFTADGKQWYAKGRIDDTVRAQIWHIHSS